MQRILFQMDAFHGDSAIMLINDALGLVDRARDLEELHYLLCYRAEVLYYEGLFNEAMRDLDEGERLAHRLADSTLIANAYNLKGLLHENIQDSQQALPYLRLALRWFPRDPAARYPVTELHHIHGNIGSYLTTLGRLDSAERHVRTSLRLAQIAEVPRARAVAWWSLGNIAIKRGAADSALACFDRSWRIADLARDHDIGVDALVGRARSLVDLGRATEARAALRRAMSYLIAHRQGIGLVTQRNFARQASRAYTGLNDLASAMERMGDWHRIDSAITANNIRSSLATQAALLRADNDLEVERLERERVAANLSAEQRARRLLTISSIVVILALTAVYLVNNARQRSKRRLAELEAMRAQQEQTIAELRVREQVSRDLHDDLGVGLSALKLRSEMALQQGHMPDAEPILREQARTAEELIASMRHIIWALQDDQGELDDLAAYIAAYARAYLDAHGLRAEVRVDGEWPSYALTTTQRRNTFLILKEALHNVVKHAHANLVRVRLSWDGGLIADVSDDGRGFQPAPERQGHGLINMAKRAEAIGAELSLGPSANGPGTRLLLRLPLEVNEG
ncbi:MAG: hypothetical protein IPM46_10245 [Flavobacteriales bacterium]|nr:hypothetical protein [Flavobacteriales bacterium]